MSGPVPLALSPDALALLTPAEMARVDALAAARGAAVATLMEAAGAAVAAAVRSSWSPRPVLVLCGPGNNGGDGFVAARCLAAAGWPVRVALLGERAALRGAAAHHAGRWAGPIEPLDPVILDGAALVIDALFGAGLSRPLDGVVRRVVEALAAARLPVVAIDVPSGLDGGTGAVQGAVAPARLTVTFFRKKPGHLLLPGRLLCGRLVVADIGIATDLLAEVAPPLHENGPALWLGCYPWPSPLGHKYRRGHALIAGGAVMTGAARLAARAAARAGAGLVTVAAPQEVWPIYAASLTGIIVQKIKGVADYRALIADPRRNALLLGPGLGGGEGTRAQVRAALATGRVVVLDADALTAFAERRAELLAATACAACVMTPHEGEFARLFESRGDKLAMALSAAEKSRAVVLLKGADTVVAAPDGRAAINANAPPDLATAGSGDVLAGLVTGLVAQGMAPFSAAAAAVWLHGAAAERFGPGLVAEDLIETLPSVLRGLKALALEHGLAGEVGDNTEP